MIKICQYLILLSTICYLLNTNVFAEDKNFFSDEIVTEMKSNLSNFLNELPKNKGQQEHIRKLLQYPEYRYILLFVNGSFSPEITSKLSQLKKPFLLIETLDMLSYNLKLNDSFSNWYFSKLLLLVNSNSGLYMTSFLRFCEKSDGSYSEWFADPLTEVIKIHTKEFSKNLYKIENRKKLCTILMTANYDLARNSIKVLAIYNEENQNKYVSDLLDCFNKLR